MHEDQAANQDRPLRVGSLFAGYGGLDLAVEHVCGALMRAGSRATAFEPLRRDKQARVFLDIPRTSWHVLLRALLGT